MTVLSQHGPPPRRHEEQERFHVVHGEFGEFEFHVGQRRLRVPKRGFVNVPAWAPHGWVSMSEGLGRLLGDINPGGMERFLQEIGTPVAYWQKRLAPGSASNP
jgi:hypothetical protein